jgi:hypothetical protein
VPRVPKEEAMKRPVFVLILAVVVALAGLGVADRVAATAEAEPAFGCCCPYSAWKGSCPGYPGPFLRGFEDVCLIVDEDGEFVSWCADDPDGVYPYRGMTWEEIALALSPVVETELRDVADILDFFCGYDWAKWLE